MKKRIRERWTDGWKDDGQTDGWMDESRKERTGQGKKKGGRKKKKKGRKIRGQKRAE